MQMFIFKFSVDSEASFVTLTECFHVNIINRKVGDYFAKQMNLQEYFACRHYLPNGLYSCKYLNCFGEKLRNEAVDHKMGL